MAILTRSIVTTSIADNSGDLQDGDSYSFAVESDTGAVAGGEPIAARLYISRMASYVSTYYIDVSFGGDTLARSDNLTEFSAQEVMLYLNDLKPALLTDSPWRIQLTNVASGGTGRKNNYRSGCYLMLDIDYEVPDPINNAVNYYDGSKWLPCNIKYYDGSKWLPCNVFYTPDGQKFE